VKPVGVTARVTDDAPTGWAEFVGQHPEATFFHQPGWLDVVRDVYGGGRCYVAAHEGDRIVGVLPLMLRGVWTRGRLLISVPFSDEGGLCAETEAVEESLLSEAESLGRALGVDSVELRQMRRLARPGLVCDGSRVALRMPLSASMDRLWDSLSRNMRKKVRRSERDGLAAEPRGADGIAPFYEVYLRNMRDLGSPMHSRRLFEAIFAAFPETSVTLLIRLGDAVAGAAFAVWFRGVFTVLCAHSLRAYHGLFPNNLLYWELFRLALDRGCTTADFGRSPRGSGIYEFKKLWGMDDWPLYYQSLPIRSQPTLDEKRAGMAYRAFARVWRLVPVELARRVGPALFARMPI
jgi:FemAB-related protein (PEP-CTERM system-associated)